MFASFDLEISILDSEGSSGARSTAALPPKFQIILAFDLPTAAAEYNRGSGCFLA